MCLRFLLWVRNGKRMLFYFINCRSKISWEIMELLSKIWPSGTVFQLCKYLLLPQFLLSRTLFCWSVSKVMSPPLQGGQNFSKLRFFFSFYYCYENVRLGVSDIFGVGWGKNNNIIEVIERPLFSQFQCNICMFACQVSSVLPTHMMPFPLLFFLEEKKLDVWEITTFSFSSVWKIN